VSKTIPKDDPAFYLWDRVSKEDLEKILPFFDDTPVRVGLVAESLNINVISITLSTDISGLIKKDHDGNFEIQVNNTDAPVRQRFTVCHEIAHYLLHRHLIDQDGITDNILYRSKLSNVQEAEANKLAAALLLPWDRVNMWHDKRYDTTPTRETVEQIASAFHASSLAVGYRFGI